LILRLLRAFCSDGCNPTTALLAGVEVGTWVARREAGDFIVFVKKINRWELPNGKD
jgi:hypothetical protein